MSDSTRPLDLLSAFAPVPTEAWEAAIAKDLKGADHERSLVWKTDEGIAVRPYYRAGAGPGPEPIGRKTTGWTLVAPGKEPALDVSAIEFHESGATAVQEVAFAIAQAIDRLAAGEPVRTVGFAVGGNHFMEIAKLRAARILFGEVMSAFARVASDGQGNAGFGETAVHLHVRTAGANKTLYDPYVNLLRVTTEALSAIFGGCDSLTVLPYRFDAHLAENVQHILREESHLDAVLDPGAGSYYIEALTGAVARAAWVLMQEIEAAGGFAAYRSHGLLDAALGRERAAREDAAACRRRVMVGTNNYPNLAERALDAAGEMPAGWRLASAFEAIRLRTERHIASGGRRPRVLLLERGDVKMRKARSAFCLNLFGCAGFEVETADTLRDADLIVLCSADAEYLDIAREVCPQAKAPVVVAGDPKDQADQLRAAGVADLVHGRSNAAETLTRWQDRLGIEG